MKKLVETDEWSIVQAGFDPANERVLESLFSLGNGLIGGRGNAEERYSGDSLPGNYLAGVYYPDPTRVGWWKNGYPDYFAKILNAPDWKPIHLGVDGHQLDLHTASVERFERRLDMRNGELVRSFAATLPDGCPVRVDTVRFVSLATPELGAIRYRITVDRDATVEVSLHVDGDVRNQDANDVVGLAEGFWEQIETSADEGRTVVVSRVKRSGFVAAVAADAVLSVDGVALAPRWHDATATRWAGSTTTVEMTAGQTLEIVKFGASTTSRSHPVDAVRRVGESVLDGALAQGFDTVRSAHNERWHRRWSTADVRIEGDPEVQQGVRFNIFGLLSTFTGDDPDLNIGPKGFTGEKYGGVTYWDTEAFCLPFYLATADPSVGRNLLRYRHRQLDKAIENATKLGFDGGAALFPMVTINGEECHNEWEITFEEIHRNGAIAFAVHDYIRHTGDEAYLLEGGVEVLVAIARFWAQRVHWSVDKGAWVMLGVTGPNEYENNVNNNWYTNLMARWSLRQADRSIERARSIDAAATERILAAIALDEDTERARWRELADGIWLGEDPERGIFLQQDGFGDKEQITVADLDPTERPLNQHWSWDRILRSPFIKQADVLQGLWVFEDEFDLDTIRRNYDFYEPLTVHESSLSPSIHAVLAVRLGKLDKALEMVARSARLDLDDINNDTEDGCHTTSMAGTWIAVVQGFGGTRVVDGALHVAPRLPEPWSALRYTVNFAGAELVIEADHSGVAVENRSSVAAPLVVNGSATSLAGGDRITG